MITGRGLYELYVETNAKLNVEIDEQWDHLHPTDQQVWNQMADRINTKPEAVG